MKKIKLLLALLILTLAATILVGFTYGNIEATAHESEYTEVAIADNGADFEIRYSYSDVLMAHFADFIKHANQHGVQVDITFDEFYTAFFEQDLSISYYIRQLYFFVENISNNNYGSYSAIALEVCKCGLAE